MSHSNDRDAVRKRLQSMFEVDVEEHGALWNDLWVKGDVPFDKGFPNPALVDVLNDKPYLFASSAIKNGQSTGKRKRALVPGCGRGYDVLLLASHGYDAYGLEISVEAVKACNEFAEKNVSSYTKDSSEGNGAYHFLLGDFFKDEWRKDIEDPANGFDLIYDYTFLSAIAPETRPQWALRMSRLLNSGGRFICVEFPTYKDPMSGGPPFACQPEIYLAHLTRPGERIPYESGRPVTADDTKPNDVGLRRIAHWRAEHTHEIGKDTDNVSVWAHVDENF